MKRRITSLAAALLILSACEPSKPRVSNAPPEVAAEAAARADAAPPVSGPKGSLLLVSDPSSALVYIDGRFVGETNDEGSLRINAAAGKVQLRLSEAGFLDAVHEVEIEAAVAKTLKVTLPKKNDRWTAPEAPIKIGVGQPFRGRIPEASAGGKGVVKLLADEAWIPSRVVVLLAGTPTFTVTGPDGKELPVTALEKPLESGSGGRYFTFEGSMPGPHTLSFTGAAGAFAIRYVQAPPPPAGKTDPALKNRRTAPLPPKR